MKIQLISKLPSHQSDQLTAIMSIQHRGEEMLFDTATIESHPAFADLSRRLKLSKILSPYLAIGEASLLYLPQAAVDAFDPSEKVRILAAQAWNIACDRMMKTLILILNGPQSEASIGLAVEGIALAAYKFEKYKTSKPTFLPEIKIVCASKSNITSLRKTIDAHLAIIQSVNNARNMVNEPGSVMTPEAFETQAKTVAKEYGLKIEILNIDKLQKEGYQGLITVGKGSSIAPRMIVLKYTPELKVEKASNRAKKKSSNQNATVNEIHLGLLGKGITFDTGGISIKPSSKMWEMKGDMAGAAAVLWAIASIAQEKLPIKTTAVMCLAQNAVDANAVLPGDIFKARNGKTIHVDNTDAEGRLILTDGLWRMGEEKVSHLVDIATLTGACIQALGTSVSGILGEGDFPDIITKIGTEQGEPCWRLPLIEEYKNWLKSPIADLNNIPEPRLAGTITAALFLREFLPESVQWAHLDIAGTFMTGKQWKYYSPGATGVMTRTMIALARYLGNHSLEEKN